MTMKELSKLRRMFPSAKEELQELYEERRDFLNVSVIKDTVKGSSPDFPYTEHSIAVQGVAQTNQKKLQRIDEKIKAISKQLNSIEQLLINIDDNIVRKAIRLFVKEQKHWTEIYSEIPTFNGTVDALRKRIEREIKKL